MENYFTFKMMNTKNLKTVTENQGSNLGEEFNSKIEVQ